MMRLEKKLVCRSALILSLLLLFGCVVKSPQVTYYSLATLGPADRDVHNMARFDVAVGVGPLTVPDYLKRVQIATRIADNRYKFAEYDRWAGLLEQDMVSVVTTNLGILLGTDRVATFPWRNYFKPDYRVAVDVIQFDSALDDDAVFSARWSISDATGQTMLASGKSDLRVRQSGSGYDALVAAESALLAQFSKQLAGEVRQLQGEGKP